MPYSVNIGVFDLTGSLSVSAITGGIWIPPPTDGSNPGLPTFAGAMTPAGSLTFPALGGPPPATSAMLVSQPAVPGGAAAFGDLFRSGPVAALPASPAPLLGVSQKSPALGQSDLDALTGNFAALTIDVSDTGLFWVVGGLSAGWIFPVTITVSSASLLLGPPAPSGMLTLKLSGTMQVSHFGVWTQTYPVAFTEFLGFAPAGDPVDTSRILAASYSSPGLSMPGVTGYIIKPLAPLVAGLVTPAVEALINQATPLTIAQALAGQTPPQQLSPQAVISANIVAVTNSALTLTLTVADIFGEPFVNLPTTTVPDVIGDTLEKARQALTAAQLKMSVTYDSAQTDDLTDVPVVEFEDPDPGQTVPVGSEVVVTVKAFGNQHEPAEEPASAAAPESAESG